MRSRNSLSPSWHWWTPPTYVNGQPQLGTQQCAGWGFQILPYLEAVDVWRAGALVEFAGDGLEGALLDLSARFDVAAARTSADLAVLREAQEAVHA